MKKIRKWNTKNTDLIQNIAIIIQTIMIIIMGWALFQSSQTIKLSQKQFETTITPILKFSHQGNNIHISNTGSISISNLYTDAQIIFKYECVNSKRKAWACKDKNLLSKLVLLEDKNRLIIEGEIKPGENMSFEVKNIFVDTPKKVGLFQYQFDHTNFNKTAYIIGSIFKYNRTVDGKSFNKLVMTIVQKDNGKLIFLPHNFAGTTFGKPTDLKTIARKDIVKTLEKYNFTINQ